MQQQHAWGGSPLHFFLYCMGSTCQSRHTQSRPGQDSYSRTVQHLQLLGLLLTNIKGHLHTLSRGGNALLAADPACSQGHKTVLKVFAPKPACVLSCVVVDI